MRIIGSIPHPTYKITVFAMNERLSLKIEDKTLEQIYKFRDGSGISTLDDVHQYVNTEFLQAVASIFNQMGQIQHKRILERTQDDDEFMTIV